MIVDQLHYLLSHYDIFLSHLYNLAHLSNFLRILLILASKVWSLFYFCKKICIFLGQLLQIVLHALRQTQSPQGTLSSIISLLSHCSLWLFWVALALLIAVWSFSCHQICSKFQLKFPSSRLLTFCRSTPRLRSTQAQIAFWR